MTWLKRLLLSGMHMVTLLFSLSLLHLVCNVLRVGPTLRGNLAERTICSKQLDDVDFTLHLQLGQQDVSRVILSSAVCFLLSSSLGKTNCSCVCVDNNRSR